MDVKTIFIASGINQTKRSLDWNKDSNIIAYAAANRLLLYDPVACCTVGTCIENKFSSINYVQWVRNGLEKNIILSLSCGSVNLWRCELPNSNNKTFLTELKLFSSIEGKYGVLSAGCASFYKSVKDLSKENLLIIVTGDTHKIFGWEINFQTGVAVELLTYDLPRRSLALDIAIIPLSTLTEFPCLPLIVYGGDDGKIHILSSADGVHYDKSGTLIGHQDWVITLEYTVEDCDILLSSGSKDGVIRLWRLSPKPPKCYENVDELQVKSLELLIPIFQEDKLEEISSCDESKIKKNLLTIYCTLESVLIGHEGLVSHVDWSPHSKDKPLQLLSCSKTDDRSVIIWQAEKESLDTDDEIWVEKTRLGEVGGNREGFLHATFGPSNDQLAATSYQGGLHIWRFTQGTWVPQPVVSGHFNNVVDLDWDIHGRYLLSVSKDQTTRLYAPHHKQDDTVSGYWWNVECSKAINEKKAALHNYKQNPSNENCLVYKKSKTNSRKIIRRSRRSATSHVQWQEIARPQVHGFDMSCIACLEKYKFVSGAEEKVIRGFTATLAFVKSLAFITNTDIDANIASYELPETASVPSLGLSNKAALNENGEANETRSMVNCVETVGLPNEDKLMLGTLWPEISKLYGHGNEMLSLAATSDGKLLASSCRANNELDAKVIIWNTEEWKEMQDLCQNRLSVTQMAFSPCDKYLLCVSRDRSWAVYERKENLFSVKFHSGKLGKPLQHARIIWSCCWIPNSLKFVTGSRDKTVVVWKPVWNNDSESVISWEREVVSVEQDEVTAVAASNFGQANISLIAIGTNDGKLILRTFDNDTGKIIGSYEVKISHLSSIRRLKFRPNPEKKFKNLQLASCGNDNAVIIYNII